MTTTMSNNGTRRVPFSQYIPHSLPTNGWSTWWLYNNGEQPGCSFSHLLVCAALSSLKRRFNLQQVHTMVATFGQPIDIVSF